MYLILQKNLVMFRNADGLSVVVDRRPAPALAVFGTNNYIHGKLSYGSLDRGLWSSGDHHGLTALSISPWWPRRCVFHRCGLYSSDWCRADASWDSKHWRFLVGGPWVTHLMEFHLFDTLMVCRLEKNQMFQKSKNLRVFGRFGAKGWLIMWFIHDDSSQRKEGWRCGRISSWFSRKLIQGTKRLPPPLNH